MAKSFYEDFLARKQQTSSTPLELFSNNDEWRYDNGVDTVLEKELENKTQADKITSNSTQYESAPLALTTTSSLMNTFKSVLDALNQRLNHNLPVYTQFVRLKVGGNILVDTTAPDWYVNNFIKLDVVQGGNGQIMECRLSLLFAPNDRNLVSIELIDKILLLATRVTIDDNREVLKDLPNYYGQCELQYGYGDCSGDLATLLRSPKFTGFIEDYSCTLDRGMLRYDLTIKAGLAMVKEVYISAKPEYIVDGADKKPLTFLNNVFNTEFGENHLFAIDFERNCIDETGVEPSYIGEDLTSVKNKNLFQLLTDVLNGCVSNSENQSYIANNQIISPSQKQVFGWYIDGYETTEAKYGTVHVYKRPSDVKTASTSYVQNIIDSTNTDSVAQDVAGSSLSLEGTEIDSNVKVDSENVSVNIDNSDEVLNLGDSPVAGNNELYTDVNINFNWYGTGSDLHSNDSYDFLIQSWTPKFEGKTLMALVQSLLQKDNIQEFQTMNDSGDLQTVASMGSLRQGAKQGGSDYYLYNTIQEYSRWAAMCQYPYKAYLTIMGCPCIVPITGVIRINAIMGSELHSSSGLYFVMKKEDSLSSTGFTTQLELIKLDKAYDPAFKEGHPGTTSVGNSGYTSGGGFGGSGGDASSLDVDDSVTTSIDGKTSGSNTVPTNRINQSDAQTVMYMLYTLLINVLDFYPNNAKIIVAMAYDLTKGDHHYHSLNYVNYVGPMSLISGKIGNNENSYTYEAIKNLEPIAVANETIKYLDNILKINFSEQKIYYDKLKKSISSESGVISTFYNTFKGYVSEKQYKGAPSESSKKTISEWIK